MKWPFPFAQLCIFMFQVTKDMYVSVMDTCGSCKGSGSEKGSKPERWKF